MPAARPWVRPGHPATEACGASGVLAGPAPRAAATGSRAAAAQAPLWAPAGALAPAAPAVLR
jgi:hypothetical protein